MVLLRVALVAGILQLALAYPSNSSISMFDKRANPTFTDLHAPLFSALEMTQIKQGFIDACNLAHAALTFAVPGNAVYAKYFNTDKDTLHNVQQVFSGIIGGSPPPDGTCSADLGEIQISKDFPNSENQNELSCTSDEDMASTRNGHDPELTPTMVLCPSLLKHGNAGPKVIPNAPPPVTCDIVKEGGQRTTWRMNTIGSTLLHEYTHVALLVEKALPQGTKDSLDSSDDRGIPAKDEFFFYGPIEIQGDLRKRVGGVKSSIIADAYTWFANEAFWTQHCGVNFGLAKDGDDEDPKYHNGPGLDPDSD